MTVKFELDGQEFVALNGGPDFTFNEAISFQVDCEDQEEVDRFWRTLAEAARRARAAGSRTATACPGRSSRVGSELLSDPDAEKAQRVMAAMLQMGKIELAELERAAAGPEPEGRRRAGRARRPDLVWAGHRRGRMRR